MIDGTNSRVEQELTGAGYSAPISRLERIIDGEDIKPLSRIEDKMKQYIAGGGGGFEELTQAQYDALSDEDKMDSEKAYYVENSTHISVNIKRVSEASSKITSSTYISDATAPWKAFNGISPSSYTSITNCWIATSADETPWICYEFDNGTLVDNVTVKFATYRAYTGDKYVKVQGSNDKDTWVDLATTELDITTEFGATTIEIPIQNNTTVYKYWRLFFPQKINGTPSTTLFVDEIYMDGTEPIASSNIIYHEDEPYRVGNKIENIGSKEIYDALSTNQKMNGDAYLIDSEKSNVLFYIGGGRTVKKENSMEYSQMNDYSARFVWDNSAYIGANVSYNAPIDVTDIDKLYFNVKLGTCYGNGQYVAQDKWSFCIGLTSNIVNSTKSTYEDMGYVVYKKYDKSNEEHNMDYIDVSELTGDYYISIFSPGWNSEWGYFSYEIEQSSKYLMYMDNKYIGYIEPTE